MVSNKLGELPSNTSGAIQAALPLLLVMWVWASHAVPKSQIFNTVPPPISSRLTHSTNADIRNLTNIQHMQLLSGILNGYGSSIKDVHKNTVKNRPPSPLSAFVSTGPYPLPLLQTSANVTKYSMNNDSWTSSNYQMSVNDCCWHWQDIELAAGCQRVISICLLPIPQTPVYKLPAAIYSACNFTTIFVTKYRTLLHDANVRTR